MSQFYVHSTEDVQRCQEAQQSGIPITITGTTADGSIRAFTGVVQAVSDDRARPASQRWRITMRD